MLEDNEKAESIYEAKGTRASQASGRGLKCKQTEGVEEISENRRKINRQTQATEAFGNKGRGR